MNIRRFTIRSLRVINLLVIFTMTLGSPMSAFAATWTDQPDYTPGSVVTISGDNSNFPLPEGFVEGVDVPPGYRPGETVQVVVTQPVLTDLLTCDATVDEYGAWSCQVTLDADPANAVGDYSYVAQGLESLTNETGGFSDASYSLTWSAADPAANKGPYAPTYTKVPPAVMPCPMPSGSAGRASDPLANAVFGSPKDSVQSLAPQDMALGQIVPFEVEITVSGSSVPEGGTINFKPEWLAKVTTGGDFGFDPAYGVYCAFVDTSDAGSTNLDGNEKVNSYSSTILDVGGSNERILGNIQVSGLDDGDRVIVEIWVVLKSYIGPAVTGNVQTGLVSAETAAGAKINIGNQTVPLLQVGDFYSNKVDLSVTKSDSPDPVALGGQLSYTLTAINNSTDTYANGVVLTDTLDPNTSFVSGTWASGSLSGSCSAAAGVVTCNIGALAPLGTATATLTVNVLTTAPYTGTVQTGECTVGQAGVDLCNRVSVGSMSTDTNTTNNSDTEPTNVVATPAITVTKTASPISVLEPGGPVTFTVRVTNTGLIPVTLGSLSDSVYGSLAGKGSCSVPQTIAAGGFYECNFTETVSGTGGSTHTNVATATADGASAFDDATVTITNVPPTVTLDKSVTPATLVEPGGYFIFTLTVTNTSAETVTITALSDTNTLSPECTALINTTLAAGASTSCQYLVEHTAVGSYDNTASVTVSDGIDTASASDSETVTVTFLPKPAISIAKTTNGSDGPSILAGQPVTWSYVVTNTGNVALTGVTVSDNRGVTVTCPKAELSAGESMTCTASGTAAPGDYSNTGTASGTYGTTTVTASDPSSYFGADPKIDIQKTPDTQTVVYGQAANFTIVVTNTGNVALTGVAVTDPLAPLCAAEIGALAAGAEHSYTCSLANVTGSFTNVATASGDYGTTTVTDNDDATVVVDILPDISVTKTADPTSVPETGGNVTFTFVVTNHSSEPFILNSLMDDKFANLDGQGTCGVPQTIAAGGNYTCAVTKTLASDSLAAHTNVVTAAGFDEQGNPGSATDSETVTFTDVAPAIQITKSANPTHLPETGGNVTFTFLVENIGQEDVTLTTLSDTVFGDLDGKGTCDVPQTILIGGSYSCAYTVNLASDSLTAHTNVATATAVDDDNTPATDDDVETVTFDDVAPAVRITKTANPTSVPETGGDVTFTFLVENTGQEDVTLNSLTDTVFGDLDGKGTCDVPQTILIGGSYSCAYTVFLSSDSLTAHTNVATATAVDDDNTPATDDDDETVTFADVAPMIRITKTASPTSVPETGGDVTFTFLVENIGQEDVTLTSLTDTVFGDLDGKGTCDVPQTILIGGSYSCAYTVFLASDSLAAHTNVATATAVDDDKTPATDDDDETVDFTDVAPMIRITKTASPTSVPETGGDVTFTFLVENTGLEDVTLTTLSDTVFGDLDGKGTCDVPQTILIGGSYSCSYTVNLASDSLAAHTNVATATAVDDDKTPATDDDDETVTFDDVAPAIRITKTASPTSVPETGGDVTFTFLVENTGLEDVTLTTLSDTVFGDLFDLTLNPTSTCKSTAIAVGGSYSCTVTRFLASDSLAAHSNVVTATGTDDDGSTSTDTDDETVTVTNVLPTVDLVKTVDSNGSFNAGDTATYTLTIKNTALEPVILTALTDTNALSAECTALVGTNLAAGASTTCTYTVKRDAAGTYPNTASVTVTDNDNSTATDSETVTVTVYAPVVSKTAAGSYDEVHDWEVFKTGAAAQKKFAGQPAGFSWTVRVDETTHGESYLVTGGITVVNPNPDDPMTMALSDVLDDGSIAAIGPCESGTLDGSNLTIPAGGTATCNYSATPTGDLDAFAAALPAQVTENLAYPGPESYFMATLTGGGALNGTYEGWCVDVDHTIYPNKNYTANVFSSYEALPAGLVEHPENFDLVNWIINQDFVGKSAAPAVGIYTYGDVQEAIWELVEDVVPAGEISHNDPRVNQIKTLAAAHEGFKPTCGDFIAVVLQPVDGSQPITIGQVTFASLGVDCAESNAVTAVLNGIDYPASAEIVWTANPVNPTATLDDDQNPAWPITVSADYTNTFTDPQGYTCPSDPAAYAGDGTAPVYTDRNTATITYEGGSKSATASTSVTCYAPVVSKNASAEYRRKYDWTVTKTADPAVHTGFAGDSFTSSYDVVVDQTVTDYGFLASGTIYVQNPVGSPGNMTVNLADMVEGGFAAAVDCDTAAEGNQTSVVVAANATKTCTYTVSLPDNTSRVNTVTGTFNSIGFPASANVAFGAPIIEGYPTVNVTDGVQGALGAASGDTTFEYERSFACSANPASYTNFADSDTYDNTATIDETGASAAATVTVNCYIPEVSKTAAGTYDERHTWTVTKTVSPLSQSAFAGDTVSYEWTVDVAEATVEENFGVTGAITVVNHNAEDAMTVALSDVLGDGTAAAITACTGDNNLADGLTIAAGGASVCDYSAAPTGRTATGNTATAVLNGIEFPAQAGIAWTAKPVNATATLDDDQNPAFPLEISEGGTWKYSESYTCSADKTIYDATTHKYSFTGNNTATVSAGGQSNSATASTAVDCFVPSISKDANGKYDEVHDWEVFKSVDTASQTAFAGEKRNFTWTVRVDETTHGESYLVTGKITVVNPNPEDALTVALNDALNDGSAAAIGPCTGGTWADPNLTVPAGGTATCDYSVTPKGDMAAFAAALPASVTINSVNPGPESYWLSTVKNDGALNGVYEAWCVDIDRTMTPGTDYTATVYSSYEAFPTSLIEQYYNMDLVNWLINQNFVGQSAAPLAGSYTFGDIQRAIWELIEDNPTATTSGLGAWNQARVDQVEALARANGEGFVPTCGDFIAVLLVPTGGQQPIAIAQVTFASLGIDCAESNAVTAVLNGVEFPASAEILWTVNNINETATLDDDQKLDWPTTVSADQTFTYTDPQGYTCPSDPAAYTNGIHQYNEANTAVLTYQTGSDTAAASTAVKCYAPVVSKTAAGAYDERHEWDVEKTVNPAAQNAFAGDTVSYEWTVSVAESVFEENFAASGTISVRNPRSDDGNMTVKLSDVLSDGFVPTITGCTGGTWDATNKTVAVPPNTTAVCDYSASLTYNDDANAPTLNTATAELMVGTTHLVTSTTANVGWTANVIRGSATLDDDQSIAFPLNISDGGTWTYKENYSCSTTRTDYGETSFWYKFGENNTAIVTSGDERDRDSASTAVNCYWPQIDLTKSGDTLSKITDKVYYDITTYNNTPADLGLRALSCTISDSKIGFNKTVELVSGAKDENLDIEFTIPQTNEDPFVNTAAVTCSPLSSTFSVSDDASWSTNLFQPAVDILKSGPLYATSGDEITYSFTINNLSSSDSPNLVLDTLSDDVLGDLSDDAPAACDELAAGASCTFTATYTVPDAGLQAFKKTNVVTVHYHPAGFPNDITDSDDHTVTIVPKGQLTDTSYCPLPNDQFRLLYHLEQAPNVYRLQASNPGQFYYNGFYYGAPGSTFTMELQIPYPFMTQEGAGNPIQVHDGTGLTSSGCFAPNPSLSGYTITTQAMTPMSSAGNQIITTGDYTTKQPGQITTVTVSGVVPATGMAYVTIHLDYGLKKTSGWKNPGTSTLNPVTNTSILDMANQTGFGSGAVSIHGYEVYNFARTVGDNTATSTPSSMNEIKKFAGFLGIVTDSATGEPLENVEVQISNSKGVVVGTLYTDEDGYYMLLYKHTAKAATYTVKLPVYNKSVAVTVKANGFAAVDFEVP